MFSLIYAWINDWVNNREAGDLRRQHGHYDVIVMKWRWQDVLAQQVRLDRTLVINVPDDDGVPHGQRRHNAGTLNYYDPTSMTFRENFEHSHWRKFIWQYCLQNVGHSACRQCDMNKWELVGHNALLTRRAFPSQNVTIGSECISWYCYEIFTIHMTRVQVISNRRGGDFLRAFS